MFDQLPKNVDAIRDWTWEDIKPYTDNLLARELTAETVDAWLRDWTTLSDLISENFSRSRVKTTQNTVDEEAEAYYKHLLATIYPPMSKAGNDLNTKLVESGLEPDEFEVPLKKMRNSIEIYRDENVPLMTREQTLGMEYAKITGAQSVEWDGEEITLTQLKRAFEDHDRERREQAWKLMMERWLQDREAINAVWVQLFETRQQMAANAGFENYRAFRWQQMNRFDYTPDDAITFQNAIEAVVVPAAKRVNERRRARMGLENLRPWDVDVDPMGRPPLKPYETIEEFTGKAEAIFNKVDPQLGGYFATMRQKEMLDIPNRKNKGPGAYCTRYPMTGLPFVFMNAVGARRDVRTLLHEVGHAFHGFEVLKLPYAQQRAYPIEYAEVASMAMELLAAPYLNEDNGGYFTQADAARNLIQHLEHIITFWPYMAVVDGFQHWAYTSGDAAKDPANCDAKWAELWDRYIHTDYTGLDEIKATGWHRKQHIYRYPFYYIEYGLAQLGAVQVWANALENQARAVQDYRAGLSLGGTRSIPELYATTGVKFAFDAATLGEAVDLIEAKIDEMEALA